jgi:hypothetical protein
MESMLLSSRMGGRVSVAMARPARVARAQVVVPRAVATLDAPEAAGPRKSLNGRSRRYKANFEKVPATTVEVDPIEVRD